MPTTVSQNYVKEITTKYKWEEPIIDLGSGNYENWYLQHFKGKKYFTLDFSTDPEIKRDLTADICNMPTIESEKFGVVLLLETLEHIYNPPLAFKESYRILKKGGLFICTTVSCWTEHKHPKDYWRFLPDGLDELLKQTCFNKLDIVMRPNNSCIASHCMCAATK